MGRKFTKEEFMQIAFVKNEHVRKGNIEIFGEYRGLERPIEYLCNKCDNIQNPVAASILAGHGCKNCGKIQSEKAQRKSNDAFQDELKQRRERGQDVYTNDEYVSSQTKIEFYCSKGHKWLAVPNEISQGSGCPYCSNQKVLVGYNDIATTSPDIFQFLASPDDGYKYTRWSNKRTDFRCTFCGHVQNRKISSLAHRGFKCECCGNGISYPNKFGRALFDQLPIKKYKAEYYPSWGKPYVYDIYFKLNDKEYIVEWDGRQHFRETGSFGVSLAEQQSIDKIKNELAQQNNVQLIRVDCSKSESDYIRHNIEQSELNLLFDLSQIDWVLCDELAQNNLVKMVCDAWMSGIRSFKELSNKFHLGNSTVRDYINRGTRLGWCDYDPKGWIPGRYHAVRVVDTISGQEYFFKSLGECADRSIEFSDHRIAEETIRKYSKKGVPYTGLIFEISQPTIQN